MRIVSKSFLLILCLITLLPILPALADTTSANPTPTAAIEVEGDQANIYVVWPGQPKVKVASESKDLLDLRYYSYLAIAPDHQKLLYVSAAQPDFSLVNAWLVNLDGSNKHKLATFPGPQLWTVPFAWSSDSSQLAYILLADGGLQLWKSNADGTGQTKVLSQNASFRPEIFYGDHREGLGWSPEGRFIEYTDRTAMPNQRYFVDPASGAVTSVAVPSRLTSDQHHLNVPIFSQNDPRWQKLPLRGCPDTLGSQGCAVSSAAMVFKYYGVNTDPQKLNDCLAGSSCPLDWPKASSDCSEGKVSGGQIQPFNYGGMQDALAKGYPVIVGFRVNTASSHFVVVTGGTGSDPVNYWVNDPWDGTSTKNLKQFVDTAGQPDQMNIFTGTLPDTYTPGQGSSRLPALIAAYNRNGGEASFGPALNAPHWWYGAVIQDFAGDPAALMNDEMGETWGGLPVGTCQAFVVRRGIFNWYAANGNPASFGLPTSDEYAVDGVARQSFGRGYIQFGAQPGFVAWPESGDGWRKTFYNNSSLGCSPAWVEYQPGFDFEGPLPPPPAIMLGQWSVSYTQARDFASDANYALAVKTDRPVKVWLDDKLLFSTRTSVGWGGQIKAGHHVFRLEYQGDKAQPGILGISLKESANYSTTARNRGQE